MVIRLADLSADLEIIREIWLEEINWFSRRLNQEHGINLDCEALLCSWLDGLAQFAPPHGRLLLAFADGQAVGTGSLRCIGEDSCEIKHMYVEAVFRRRGIGRAMVDALLDEARQIGYTRVCLDTGRYMRAAPALYRSLGFKETEPYEGSEVRPEHHHMVTFMELRL